MCNWPSNRAKHYSHSTLRTTIQHEPATLRGQPFAKSCKVDEVYDERVLKHLFIEGFDAAIWHSLRVSWTTSPQGGLMHIALQAESLLSNERDFGRYPSSNCTSSNPAKPYFYKQWNSHMVTSNINTKTTSNPPRRTRRLSPFTQPLKINVLNIPSWGQSSAQSSFSSMPLVISSFGEACYDTSNYTPRCPLLLQNSSSRSTRIRSRSIQKLSVGPRQKRPTPP